MQLITCVTKNLALSAWNGLVDRRLKRESTRLIV